MSQEEGQFANLELQVRNPRTPLLGGLIWLWFSYSVDTDPAVPLFFGRLVGIPQNIFEERVTLQFVARPLDYSAQKEAVAEALRVLPHFDRAFIDEQHREDPDVVLEAYPRAWHIDRVTHEVDTSDVLIAEDGVLDLAAVDLLYRGFAVDLNQIPLTAVSIDATLNWTQIAKGEVSLTAHIVDNWPNEENYGPGIITSFTLQPDDWPKPFGGLGDNWTVADASCAPQHDLQPISTTDGLTLRINWGTGAGTTTTSVTNNDQSLKVVPPGSIALSNIITATTYEVSYSKPDPVEGTPPQVTSINSSVNFTNSIIPLHHLKPTLTAAYDAARPRTERVRFTLLADVQPIATLPGDDEALRITLNSTSLNELIDPSEGTDGEFLAPIGDPRRRSYVVTERGLLSLEYLIALARSHLVKRARVVQLTHVLTMAAALQNIPQITLRRNATLSDPRLPNGEALGKIIAYRFAIDGNAGRLDCSITTGCAIGRGGEVEVVGGEPTYADESVMGPDVQEFTGGTVLFDTSVGYTPPLFVPGDDGINFQIALTAADVIEEALAVENPPATQRTALEDGVAQPGLSHGMGPWAVGGIVGSEVLDARTKTAEKIMEEVPTAARFKLKSMTRAFEAAHNITVTELKIPTMIDLESGT
jgi:hypothetical protein